MVTGVNQFNLDGFAPDTDYAVYLVAQDTSGNLQANVSVIGLKSTLGTSLSPPISFGLDVGTVGTGSAMVNVILNESGTGHFVVLTSGSSIPSALQVKA